MTSLPKVHLATLGGTITMTSAGSTAGVEPTGGAADLLDAVPQLRDVARVGGETLLKKPGASLSIRDVLAVHEWAETCVARGADGMVVVQGTDTMEEVAYLLDLLWSHDQPLVVTGALRAPGQLSADGPANLAAAVTVAGSSTCRGLGALVVINDEIHAARRVVKLDTCALQAFSSQPFGLLGRVHEGHPSVANRPPRPPAFTPPAHMDHNVPLLESTLGDDGSTLALLLESSRPVGIVLAGFGAGHVSGSAAEVLARSSVPIVLASRTGHGPVLEATYAFSGSERDLISHGAIPAGWLHPRKARLLLMLLLASGLSDAQVRDAFAVHGAMP